MDLTTPFASSLHSLAAAATSLTGHLALLTAPAEEAAEGGGLLRMLMPFALMFGVIYVVMILPERKKQKQRTAMLDALKKGDRVMTTSGILAKVVSVAEEEVRLEIADGVRVLFSRQAVQLVLDPAKDKGKEAKTQPEDSEAASPA